jgi:hypothetical protein
VLDGRRSRLRLQILPHQVAGGLAGYGVDGLLAQSIEPPFQGAQARCERRFLADVRVVDIEHLYDRAFHDALEALDGLVCVLAQVVETDAGGDDLL